MTQSEVVRDLMYGGENPKMITCIVDTILRLPPQVGTFALERCYFISVGIGVVGLTFPGHIGVNRTERRSRNCWIIILDDRIHQRDIHGAIAHEIAHAWRGDDRAGFNPEDCERKAALLAAEWGFTGKGVDPEHCDI